MWLLLAFVTVPLIEIALFIQVGGWLSLWPTLGLILLTGVIGTVLVRRQGLSVLREVQGGLATMRDPLSPLAHGALILLAGVLLLTPGFLTDGVGFLLLIPALRRALISAIAARLTVVTSHPGPADVVDGEWTDVTEVRQRHVTPPDWTRR
ncbi:MAG: FxsA family protein [Paracoccaceae bacterium]|nr:MAG: FxsA family protein [Paracoccaceae bacterium]